MLRRWCAAKESFNSSEHVCLVRAQSVGAHSLLSGEEEKELAFRVQELLRLEALAAPEMERLGRSLEMHEWAAAADEPDVSAFTARVLVRATVDRHGKLCMQAIDSVA